MHDVFSCTEHDCILCREQVTTKAGLYDAIKRLETRVQELEQRLETHSHKKAEPEWDDEWDGGY